MVAAYRQPQLATYPFRPAAAPFARSLADASLGEVVFQGGLSGTVHAPASGARLALTLSVAPVVGLLIILGVGVIPDLVDRFDSDRTIVACVFGGIFVTMGLLLAVMAVPVGRAAVLVNTGRLDEAQAILSRWSGSRSLQTGNLYGGMLASVRGDLPLALERYGKLLDFLGRLARTSGLRGSAPSLAAARLEGTFHVVRILCDLGRVQEAGALLQSAGPPWGEYVTLLRVVAERYVHFNLGLPTQSHAELAQLAGWASSLRGSWGLLALAGWGYAGVGDHAAAARLVAEERARPNAARLALLMPRLWAWMQSVQG